MDQASVSPDCRRSEDRVELIDDITSSCLDSSSHLDITSKTDGGVDHSNIQGESGTKMGGETVLRYSRDSFIGNDLLIETRLDHEPTKSSLTTDTKTDGEEFSLK
jgi:hypothetical protein